MSTSIGRSANLEAMLDTQRETISPDGVPLIALLDADRVVAELEMAANTMNVSFCLFVCDLMKPEGLDPDHGPLYPIAEYCATVIERGGPTFAKRCIASNWAAAKEAAQAGHPVRASCACGEGLLHVCPIHLTSEANRHPKLCITCTAYPLSCLHDVRKLSELTSIPEADLERLIAEVQAQCLPPEGLRAIRKGIEILASNISAEMSSRYQLRLEEKALVEAERRLQQEKKELEVYRWLVDNVDDFIIMADIDGRILTGNRKISSVLGYSLDEMRNLRVADLCLTDDGPVLVEAGLAALAKGIARGRVTLVAKDGGVVVTEMNLCYSPEANTYQAIFRDITDRLRMESELHRRSQQIELRNQKALEATEIKARFFASMSHEFRTPLTSVIGFAEVMLEDEENPLTPRQRDNLAKVVQKARQLLRMVDELLDIAKIESGRMRVKLSNVDIGQVVHEVMASVSPMLRGKDVRLTADISPDLISVRTDERKFSEILTNLVSNAAKFTDRGSITISAGIQEGKVHVAVCDTGVGIKRSDFRRIFDDFEQLDNQLAGRSKGTGLGLPLAKRLCYLIGGRIKVESKLGVGTTFTVILPLDLRQSIVLRRTRALRTNVPVLAP